MTLVPLVDIVTDEILITMSLIAAYSSRTVFQRTGKTSQQMEHLDTLLIMRATMNVMLSFYHSDTQYWWFNRDYNAELICFHQHDKHAPFEGNASI